MNHWLEKVDPKSGRTYWGNTKTKETTWNEPEELRKWKQATKDDCFWQCVDKRSGKTYYINQRTKETTWHRPLGTIQQYNATKKTISSQPRAKRDQDKLIVVEEKEGTRMQTGSEAKSDVREVVTVRGRTQARSSASILEGGVIEGAVLYRGSEKGDYQELTLRLDSGKLTCSKGNEVIATYLLHRASSILLSDSANVLRLFEIEADFGEASNVFLAFSDIRDVLLWLEALQLSMQRGKVFESLKETSQNQGSVEEYGLRLDHSEDIMSKLTAKRNSVSDGDNRQSYKILSAVSSHHHRKFIGHGAALSIQRGFRVKRQADGIQDGSKKVGTFKGWLQEHGIEEFEQKICEAGYDDLELLSKLTEQDLKEFLLNDIKIDKPGHRMKVYVAVRLLAKQRPSQVGGEASPRTRTRAKTSGGM